MPRENKKRGRRAEAARKLRLQDFEVLGEVESTSSKRRRTGHSPSEDRRFEEVPWVGRQPAAQVDEANAEERPFYGLLDEQEQDYFKMVDGILEADNFADQEERNIFLQNVYKEAEGKELKLACSQSCSRFLERLIILSTPAQLKHLLRRFNGQ